jgi:lantibiotic modifying enzyme
LVFIYVLLSFDLFALFGVEAFPCGTGLGWKSISDSPLTGMAHGASGFAVALAKLFQITGDIRYRETAIGALQFERSQFCGDTQNWFDRRGDVPDPTIVQWCTGAPGIGLARIPLITLLNDPHLNNEMEIALKTTIQKGFGKNHSLCHGDGGNIDFVLQATPFLKTKKHLEIGISHLSTSVEQHGWLCGTPDHLETPGLMVGLSGIGMSLLRLISSEIPSVLLLEM